ncbi:MAG TPA: phospholipase D-like domain-containing protein [Candidatus Hydrogenedentes bacterium]|nr:phospholipase D-like domain-containing protein [Candidatus Hydrogenedentota bacterium]
MFRRIKLLVVILAITAIAVAGYTAYIKATGSEAGDWFSRLGDVGKQAKAWVLSEEKKLPALPGAAQPLLPSAEPRNAPVGTGPILVEHTDAPKDESGLPLPDVAGFFRSDKPIQVFFAPAAPLTPWGIDDKLVALLAHATQSIDAAFYEFQLQKAADTLILQHQKGVAVRLVSDSNYEDREAIQSCIRAGIPVVFDNREAFMHNKFCVVDGRCVWTGSANLTENDLYRNNNNALMIDSPELAQDYAAEFSEMFVKKKFGGRSPENTPYPIVNVAGIAIECYFSPEDHPQKAIIREIRESRTRIDFLAFSFTSKPIAEAMADQIKNGVRVRGVVEARNASSESCMDEYLRTHGAEVHPDANDYNMHDKVMILDGETVITGSYNFSKSAEKKNDENVLIIHDAGIAETYTREFESLFK